MIREVTELSRKELLVRLSGAANSIQKNQKLSRLFFHETLNDSKTLVAARACQCSCIAPEVESVHDAEAHAGSGFAKEVSVAELVEILDRTWAHLSDLCLPRSLSARGHQTRMAIIGNRATLRPGSPEVVRWKLWDCGVLFQVLAPSRRHCPNAVPRIRFQQTIID
jgi:hypothetical protein